MKAKLVILEDKNDVDKNFETIKSLIHLSAENTSSQVISGYIDFKHFALMCYFNRTNLMDPAGFAFL